MTLSETQQEFLKAAYLADQTEEAKQALRNRQRQKLKYIPAKVWRALPFGDVAKQPSRLKQLCPAHRKPLEIWKQLEQQRLLTVSEQAVYGHSELTLPHITLNRAGRKAAKELFPELPTAEVGIGEWSWELMALLWTEEQGRYIRIHDKSVRYPIEAISSATGNTHSYFQALSEDSEGGTFVLTSVGRERYRAGWLINSLLYPHIPAPKP